MSYGPETSNTAGRSVRYLCVLLSFQIMIFKDAKFYKLHLKSITFLVQDYTSAISAGCQITLSLPEAWLNVHVA